ncbi:MAG: class I SAM-dependent methyltransferase [Hydrogenophaga sp.]|uniref:class I SAM-dependent methyltransferase n=1 Tax=Hydrogenophaga sp. TaxID=1904254 RepID=UPI00257E5AE2|nr:class I SAM-dependent methyltransferase [Hydrogenophaga sp.]MBL0946231.1 class I SAM-dependent methyltransferase [Hydrogenophaga sp.]
MKICITPREGLYQVLAAVFDAFDRVPTVAELGVLKGDNALQLHQALRPEQLLLVDAWSAASNAAYCPFEQLPPWVTPVAEYAYYYGGPMDDPQTWERLYQSCASKFEGRSEVSLIRQDSYSAYETVRQRVAGRGLDLLYVDANHQYEYVLRDLMTYQDLVRPDGLLMLNDCCHSEKGARQNLGVLEALGSFIKRSDFVPVAMTNTDWTDVVLARKGSHMVEAIDTVLVNADIPFVELPHQLITAARIRNGRLGANLSFC